MTGPAFEALEKELRKWATYEGAVDCILANMPLVLAAGVEAGVLDNDFEDDFGRSVEHWRLAKAES